MKLTYSWLLEHLQTPRSARELSDVLTRSGMEVEGFTDLGQGLERVQSGVLMAVERHPNADRLTVCRVLVGGDGLLNVVCGATNHKVGDAVAVAREGAVLPHGLTIRKGKIRGETSEGMLCSLTELGMAEKSDGILILPPGTAAGQPIAALLGREEVVLELNITPNRGDCLSVRGVARDLAAVLEAPMLPLESGVNEDPEVAGRHPVQVILEDGEGCPRYAGRVVEGVRIGPSPEWLKRRLESVGLRSLNNVVDATNFVMLELGQPLHAFDLAKLAPPVVVRKARSGEKLLTLDGVERELSETMTVIADQNQALALGGILGGESSAVSDSTVNLFLESAYFDAVTIARAGRKLGVITDSRHRFERGVDPEGQRLALDRLTRLIVELAGGTAGPALAVESGAWRTPEPILLRPERVNRRGGIDLAPEAMTAMLERLECQRVREEQGTGRIWFQPPSHRHDLRIEEDLLEEVIRLHGYDRVPATPPVAPLTPAPEDPLRGLVAEARRWLAGQGYLECVNYAFISREAQRVCDAEREPVALLNPISEELAVMRTRLAPGLIESAKRNLHRGAERLRLFECGRVFLPQPDGTVREPEQLAGLMAGPLVERAWHTPARMGDFFDLKGDVERLLIGLRQGAPRFAAGGPEWLHPGRKAVILLNDREVGWLGQLHPRIQASWDLPQPALLFELDLAVAPTQGATGKTTALSRFPGVTRDFAFLVPREVPAMELLEGIRGVDPLARESALFDLYEGEHLPEGMKSLAVGVLLQAEDRTLTDAEAQEVAGRIVAFAAERFGARLRGG
ncbi:MAG: phenylalanine--tRNA ligase subunit beta [Magnetococcales bacterium]|nr:phenylalanine--tRNA ligase subunit beta [Magnetococcales bacterium]